MDFSTEMLWESCLPTENLTSENKFFKFLSDFWRLWWRGSRWAAVAWSSVWFPKWIAKVSSFVSHDYVKLTYSLVWKDERIGANFFCIKEKQPFVSTFCFMRNLSIWMYNPKINYLLIPWTYVPSSSYFGRSCRNVLIESLFHSTRYLDCQHVFWLKIVHMVVPLIHYVCLISLPIWHSIFNDDFCLLSHSRTLLDSNCFLLYSFNIRYRRRLKALSSLWRSILRVTLWGILTITLRGWNTNIWISHLRIVLASVLGRNGSRSRWTLRVNSKW